MVVPCRRLLLQLLLQVVVVVHWVHWLLLRVLFRSPLVAVEAELLLLPRVLIIRLLYLQSDPLACGIDLLGLCWFPHTAGFGFSDAEPMQAPLGDYALLKPQLVHDHALPARDLVLSARGLVLPALELGPLLICN